MRACCRRLIGLMCCVAVCCGCSQGRLERGFVWDRHGVGSDQTNDILPRPLPEREGGMAVPTQLPEREYVFSVPEGRCENSPAIYRWDCRCIKETKVPSGTTEAYSIETIQPSLTGLLLSSPPSYPAMNCRAIAGRPSGTQKTYERQPDSLPLESVELCSVEHPTSQPAGNITHAHDQNVVTLNPATQPATTSRSVTRPATSVRPATQRAKKRGYTAPSIEIQQMSLAGVTGQSSKRVTLLGAGKELAESSLTAAGSLRPIGQPGLAASQPRVFDLVVSRPGLQRGFAAGLGLAGRRTILTLQRNPSAGPCRDLVRAGFFPNQGACAARLRR